MICKIENKITPFLLSQIIRERNMKILYPNIEIALRIFVSTPAFICTAERSFSVLKTMKNYLRSTISQDRLNSFLNSEKSDLTSSLEISLMTFQKKKTT